MKEITTTDLPLLQHWDYNDLSGTASYDFDADSGMIFNASSCLNEVQKASVFTSAKYADSEIDNQKFFVSDYKNWVTRSRIQTDLLAKYCQLQGRNIRLLDIGCNRGNLLLNLKHEYPALELHGQDINPYFRKLLECENIGFDTSLEETDGQFDVIVISHSIMYVDDLMSFAATLQRLLAPNGMVFLQFPSIAENPMNLLMGDQFNYATPANIACLFSTIGTYRQIEHVGLPQDDIGIIQRTEIFAADVEPDVKETLDACLDKLYAFRDQLVKIEEPVAVLGTTARAAFSDQILCDRVAVFIDENKGSQNTFRSKEVLTAKDYYHKYPVLLVYGERNAKIAERMRRDYQVHRFILL